VLCWAFCFSAYSNAQTLDATGQLVPGQEYSTGNLVIPTTTASGSTWVNGVYQDSLTCWGWGDPGYCGPNPIVRPNGNINFSWGQTDLYQQQLIANILPYTGTGLRVNGYNFGFTAKNGNGWDDGRTDMLMAYVQFNGPNGTLMNNTTDLSYGFNWTRFNLSQTFATPYSTQDLTSVRYGFVGRDNNFWAGPYGPEINSVEFNLRYSVDPCAVNVLSSPSCPGYLEAMSRYTATTSYELAPTATISADPMLESVATSTVMGLAVPSSIVAATVTPQRERSAGPSTGQLLGIIRAEQSRLGTLENSVTQQANQTSQQAAQDAQSQSDRLATLSATQSVIAATTFNSVGGTGLTLPSSAVGNPGAAVNILNAATTSMSEMTENNKTNQTRRQVQDNEAAAGGVSMASFTAVPVGFSAYQTALTDASFYAPKEIYRGQKNVDNARLLRGLTSGSDRVHEQMIQQQYPTEK